jgi:hypothetical protein
VILTQGFASGFTLGYCPTPLRGWNTVDIWERRRWIPVDV